MMRPSAAALTALFRPHNVALVGATDRSAWSHSIFARFGDYGHKGQIFAVNRNGTMAHGLAGYRSVAEIPVRIDTAFIYVPAAAVVGALREAAEAGARYAVILSSGFAEAGAEGGELQAELCRAAAETGVTMLGPNSLGFANFAESSFCTSIRSRLPVRSGRLAIVSQSGAVAAELAKWAHAQAIGLSFFCATGNEAQLGIADVVDYLAADPATGTIALYVEGINDPARFMAAAAQALRARKPVVVLKVGRSAAAHAVIQAHTGALTGDDAVFDAMCRRFGVTRVDSIEELITTADFLGRVGPINPPFIGMASISGGACAMYADLAEAQGLAMPAFAPATRAALRGVLPDFAATLNPLDVTGAAVQTPAIWAETIPILLREPGMGLIVSSHNPPNTDEEARNLKASFVEIAHAYRQAGRPPVILNFSMQDVSPVQQALREELGLDIVLPNLALGVRALAHLQRWSAQLLTPDAALAPMVQPACRPVSERDVLDYLAARDVPVVPAMVAADGDAAVAAAVRFGMPVAMKIASPDIAHKTEAGGVRLNVQGEAAVRQAHAGITGAVRAYMPAARIDGVIVSPMRAGGTELIVGVIRDPQWGAAIIVGLGGVFTELLRDKQVRLLPVTTEEAEGMLQGLRGAAVLHGFRGGPAADLPKLARVITAIGDAALALGNGLAALEVNPLWVNGGQIECLDGLAVYADGVAAVHETGAATMNGR
jgi:acetate---CoA ligase (ADP-forming)